MNSRTIIIGIVAGESSGDILGAGLIKSLKKYLKKVCFFGVGGVRMKAENMQCWYDVSELSIMGIFEVILKSPKLLIIKRKLINRFLELKLDIFIGIDFPDFNFSLEKSLKKKGIRIIHYVSPSVWAWRYNRIFSLKKSIDNILLLFPFEKSIYKHFNIPYHVIGHVLADEIPLSPNKKFMRQKLGIPYNKCCLAILPGSRLKEIKMLAHDFLSCAKLLKNNIPNLEILVSLGDENLIDQFVKLTSSILVEFKIFNTQKSWEVMAASDVSLLASGTATLECMLAKCPMVVAYRVHPLTFMLAQYLIKIPWISLPNILAGYKIVPEFIQKKCNPKDLAKTLLDLLKCNNERHFLLKSEFYRLHQSIKLQANDKAAEAVLKLIKL